MKLFILLTLILPSIHAAKLLDKTVAIFNDQVITLSQVKRIRSNLDARRNIQPQTNPWRRPSGPRLLAARHDGKAARLSAKAGPRNSENEKNSAVNVL